VSGHGVDPTAALERDLLFLAMSARGLPESIGPWIMLRPLGRGGSGPVFLAEEEGTGRRAAVRLLAEPGREATVRASRERIGFRHPAAAEVFAVGEDWIATEPTGGVPLSRVLAAGRREPPADRKESVRPLLSALAAVGEAIAEEHAAGRIHGGVSPRRIDVRSDGSLVIRDFGFDPMLGSPHHVAPEQAGAPGETGPATDVYSFASTIHAVATGRPLFESRSLTGLLAAIREAPLPDLPPALAPVLGSALARDPAARPTTPAALISHLREDY
jgi:serine/threonine protein kinase